MTDRPTPETDAALYRGMTATMSHAMLQRLERERDEARDLFESSKRARQSLSDACDHLHRQLAEAQAKQPLPWRHIGELGEIAYMEDGSRCWTFKPGYEDTRLFLVYLASGDIETHLASIDDGGALCNEHGDDVGWLWCDAEYFMDIPARPTTPSNPATIR